MSDHKQGEKPSTEEICAKKICGVIMPISETATFSERHWSDFQSLLHRVIKSCGFEPKNVWEGSLNDRISSNIIANIFAMPIVVADISDQNPNVMLELGMRLSSKKPTIVVCVKGQRPPFDISDLRAIFYPPDLNILGIEKFFTEFSESINEKYDLYKKDDYEPFLSHFVIDVVSPRSQEITANDLLIKRLANIEKLIAANGSMSSNLALRNSRLYLRPQRVNTIEFEGAGVEIYASTSAGGRSANAYSVGQSEEDAAIEQINSLGLQVALIARGGLRTYFAVLFNDIEAPTPADTRAVLSIVKYFGGDEGVPEKIWDAYMGRL